MPLLLRSEEHTSELQSPCNLVCRLLLEKKNVRLHQRLHGKLAHVLDTIQHGHHVFRAYWKNGFLKQYEKFSRYLRNELCSFFFNDTATTEIYTLSLPDALPI